MKSSYKNPFALERIVFYAKEMLQRGFDLKFYWYRLQWNIFPRLSLVPRFPIHMDIEVSDACNLRCAMCVHGLEEMKNVGFIDKDFARKMIQEAALGGVSSIKFNWRGEPALHKDLPDLVAFAKQMKIGEVQINTNGLPFTKEAIERLIDAGIDRVIFSVDADTAETYAKIRIGGDFNKLVRNINYFIEYRNKKKSKKPFIRVQYVRMKENEGEIKAFMERWHGRVDDIRVTDVTDRGQGKAAQVDDQIAVGRARCTQPWLRMVVSRDGLVMPCCSDWYCRWVIGDARKDSLKDIWRSEKMRQLRKLIFSRRLDEFEPCKSCFVKESYVWQRVKK